MSRSLAALLAVAALVAGVVWYATARAPSPLGSVVGDAAPAAGDEGVDPTLLEGEIAHDGGARGTRTAPHGARQAAAVPDADGADAGTERAVGRVVFPPGTPDDEDAWIVASGDVSSARRVPVAPDGGFAVSFGARDSQLWIDLDARYLWAGTRRMRRGREGELVIEPELVGRLVLVARAPAGWSGPPDGLLNVHEGLLDSHRSHFAERRLDEWGELVFDAAWCGPGHVTFDGEGLVLAPPAFELEAGVTTTLELELRPGVRIGGRVVDERGEPVQRARVVAGNHGDPFRQADRTARTDGDGTFLLRALRGGKIRVWAEADGFAPAHLELGALAGGTSMTDLELVLTSGGTIAGRVTWPDGEPAPARVTAADVADRSAMREAPCEDDGTFRIAGLIGDRFLVTASAERLQSLPVDDPATGERVLLDREVEWTARLDDVPIGSEGLALVLSRGLVLGGRVIDDLGDPVPHFSVTVQNAGAWRRGEFRGTDGFFAVEGLAPGTWRMNVWAVGYVDAGSFLVTMPRTDPLDVRLSRGATVRGVVLDVQGKADPGATVVVHPEGGTRFGTGVSTEGRFEITGLVEGRIVLTTEHASDASCAPVELVLANGEVVEDVVLRATQGSRIRGELIDRDGGAGIAVGVTLNAPDLVPRVQTSTMTDDVGRFEFDGLAPGSYTLGFRGDQGLGWSRQVALGAGETAELRIETPSEGTVLLRGRLRASGEPLADATLVLRSVGEGQPASHGHARSGADGRYEARLLGPGRYSLWLSTRQWSVTEELDVPATSEHVHDRDFALGRIAGRVTSSDGTPLRDVSVQARDANEVHFGQTYTGADGGYELVVPAGEYLVGVRSTENGRPATVRADGRVRGVDLVDEGE